MYRFKLIVEKEPSGGFSAYIPSLIGCATQGETMEETVANAKEAAALYIQSLKEDGLSVPESDVFLEEIEVSA